MILIADSGCWERMMFGKSDRDDVSSDASPTQKKPRHAAAVASTRINTPSSAKTNKAPPSHKKPSTPASAPVPPVVNADSLKKLLGRAAPKKIPLTPSSIFNHELLSGLMNSNGDEAKKEEAKRDEGYSCYISKKNKFPENCITDCTIAHATKKLSQK